MSRFVLPAGMVALLLGAFTLAAQVREEPRQTPPAPAQAGHKDLKPDKDAAGKKAPADIKKAHRRSRVYLGVFTVPVEDLSNRTRKKMKLQNTDGVIVVDVMPDSPAEEAGLRHGDVITHVNGKLIEDEEELSEDLNQIGPGKPVKLAVVRDGKKQEIKAELEEHPANEFPAGGVHEEEIDEIMGMCHHNAQRIEWLERKISRLERRLAEMEKSRSAKSGQ
jgi:membrane-associated protease RseP (regulator of RpoE activity)